jgi:hypothetical protein
MRAWDTKAGRSEIERAVKALNANGIEATVVPTGAEAKDRVLGLLPKGAEVFTMTSVTLDSLGISAAINGSGNYTSVRAALNTMDPKTQGREMRKLGASPDFAVGSAHAVTETGTVVIGSLTGSQLPAYAFGAGTLIWVVGAQKIVKDVAEGLRRIDEYLVGGEVPGKESVRARAAYGLPESFRTFPSKVLLFNKEVQPGRVKLIIVDEVVGN